MQPTIPTTAPARRRRLIRSLIFVLATGAATVAAVGAGFAPTSAQADPGETRVPIGSGQLVQSEDLSSIQLPLDTSTLTLGRDDDFSACLGEGNPWTAVLPGSPGPISSAWTRRGHADQALYENIAQAADEAQARQFAAMLVSKGVRGCQKPVYDFHYGKLITGRVGAGVATWAVRYRGTSIVPDGGVAVIRKGSNVGFVEFTARSTSTESAEQTAESVAKVATNRLVMSS